MAKECGDLLHPHMFATSGAETEGLVFRSSEDEGLEVPEPDGMRNRGIALAEKVLKLVYLEEVGDGLVTAEFAVLTLPPLVTNLLLLLEWLLSLCHHQQ